MILVIGKNGQLASSLGFGNRIQALNFYGKSEVNLLNFKSLIELVSHLKPKVIINCAAYTNVDEAETQKDECYALNVKAVSMLCEICSKKKIHLIQISSDFVFDGLKKSPYQECDKVNSLNIYGASKILSEELILSTLSDFTIIRTSWLYSSFAKNFFKSIIDKALTMKNLNVVSFQRGSPTDALELSHAIGLLLDNLEQGKNKIFHFSSGVDMSWYEFATKILEIAMRDGYLENIPKIFPSETIPDYSVAKRPEYSVLDSSKFYNEFQYNHIDINDSISRTLNLIFLNRQNEKK